MNKLELPKKGDWTYGSQLQIRIDPIRGEFNDNKKLIKSNITSGAYSTAEVQLRTINIAEKNYHGSPTYGKSIIVKKKNLVEFLNAHYNHGDIIGYRYYGGIKSKLTGVKLPEIIESH